MFLECSFALDMCLEAGLRDEAQGFWILLLSPTVSPETNILSLSGPRCAEQERESQVRDLNREDPP